MADDVLAGDDADETAHVIHDRDEVLIHCAVQQFIHRDGDAHGRVSSILKDISHPKLFQLLHRAAPALLLTEKPPEEIPLADSAHVLPGAGDHRDGRVAVVTHFFQTLAEGVVVVHMGDTGFGE